ncbi:MAG: translation initiation factor IF-2, partial [Bacteroidales bacterium]|nr:translation initiation factor IF-2 [Bacteroidales bacterium]
VGKERQGKSKGKDKKQSKYKVDFTDEEITEQIRKTYSGMAPVKKSQASKHRKEKREHIQQELMEEMERNEQEKSVLKVTEFITANELATMMNKPVTDIISVCMSLGLAVAINQRLSAETISLLAENYGFTVQFVGLEEEEEKPQDREEDLVPRAPIITVMGHVDHGKTSLLDYIRNTNVIQGEAGGITQHIGAYEVKVGDKSITFLDTPGHEAFTAMRARGASITDIVIIVIAADDQIMPQTIEAINHAQAAGVPMIFAINKIDKPGADPEKIRAALANMNILVEEWGGKVQSQDISAKKGTNVDLLLEKVLIEAEMLDLKANPKAEPTGTVIESSLDKGRGYVAKILVQNGTLRTGDIIAAGTSYGKIRAMYNEKNQIVKEAGPSVPVLLLGLNSAPQAGDTFRTYKTDKEARAIVNKRSQLLREQGLRTQKHITLDELGRRIAVGDFQELNVIVKGDVDGSIEALSDEILKLSTADVQVNVIHKSVGQVTESDVLLASASNAIIIAFQVRPSSGARKLAEQEQVDIRVYSVIYSAIDDLKAAIAGMKAPEVKEQVVANLEVRETFRISKVGVIAGCYVLDGKIQRSSKVRVIRDGIVIHDNGRLGSLKRFKDDAKEVSAGLECGLNIESFNDVVVGDQIEAYEEIEVPVK